ncbi:Gibberellin-regulated protein 14, partial [Linum perenne]
PQLPLAPTPAPSPPSYTKPPPDCVPLCSERYNKHSRPNLCNRACMTCCGRCKCMPPSTYGNRENCGTCYTGMTTCLNKPKCP